MNNQGKPDTVPALRHMPRGRYNPPMAADEDPSQPARHLWSATWQGVLATQSAEHPGYPFGSVVPFILGQDGQPLLLFSHLSQHTRNIASNPHCSLTLVQPGVGDVQQLARLTALGDVRLIEDPEDATRYFRYFPHARIYRAELGFRFYRFAVHRLHWNGGFATARWFGRDRIVRANPLDPPAEQRIVQAFNEDHAQGLRRSVQRAGHTCTQAKVELLGIDGDGLDLRCGEQLLRLALPRPIDSADDARAMLEQMAND